MSEIGRVALGEFKMCGVIRGSSAGHVRVYCRTGVGGIFLPLKLDSRRVVAEGPQVMGVKFRKRAREAKAKR